MYPSLVEIQLTVDVAEQSDGWMAKGKLRIGVRTVGLHALGATARAALVALANGACDVLEDPPSSPAPPGR
jgi:hypothetical protein